MCFHTRYGNDCDVEFSTSQEGGVNPTPLDTAERVRQLARIEADLFGLLVREVERNARVEPPLGPLRLVQGPYRPDEEIMYNCGQLSRLAASLVISFNLSGLRVESDVLSVPFMAQAASFGDASTLLKQFLAWPLSAKQASGECPKAVAGWNYEYLFGVSFRRLIRGRILNPSPSHARQALILAECMLRCKRSAHEVSPIAILEAMKDHGKEIGSADLAVVHLEEMERVKKWIGIVVDGIIPNDDECRPSLRKVLPPGTACYEETRSRGGCLIGASTHDPLFADRLTGTEFGQIETKEIHSMHWTPNGGLKTSYVKPSQYVVEDFFITKEHPAYSVRIEDILLRGTEGREGYISERGDDEGDDGIRATAVPILEPLKVRMITKGESVPYLEAKRLQTQLTTWMKTGKLSRFFPALHGWISEEVLDKRFCGYLSNCAGPQEVLSGDYKGATDTLRRDVSLHAVEEILSRLPEYDTNATAEVMKMCLTEHRLKYSFAKRSEWRNEGLKQYVADDTVHEMDENGEMKASPRFKKIKWQVRQKKGQLMGSYLSFPILNIINAAVHFAYFEHRGMITDKWSSYKDAPFLVNGDDVLAVGPKGSFDTPPAGAGLTWEEYVGIVGFRKSLGKNYVSSEFCTVNSTLFEFRDQLPDNGPRRGFKLVACPRVERMYNQEWYSTGAKNAEGMHNKVFQTNHKVGPGMVGGLVRELLSTVDRSRHELAVRLFVEMNKPQLKAVGLPWFVPEDLGGLGIPCLPEMEAEWKNDGKVVAYITRKWNTQDGLVKVPNVSTKDTNRPCDIHRSQFNMDYLKNKGYRPTLVIDPTPEELRRHEDAPKPVTDPLVFLAEGAVPSLHDDTAFARKLQEQRRSVATIVGKASKTDLTRFSLHEHTIRVLWLPYCYTRESVPQLV